MQGIIFDDITEEHMRDIERLFPERSATQLRLQYMLTGGDIGEMLMELQHLAPAKAAMPLFSRQVSLSEPQAFIDRLDAYMESTSRPIPSIEWVLAVRSELIKCIWHTVPLLQPAWYSNLVRAHAAKLKAQKPPEPRLVMRELPSGREDMICISVQEEVPG